MLLSFALVGGLILAQPQVNEIYKRKQNEHISYIVNITGATRAEFYIEYLDNCSIIDVTQIDYLENQTYPIVESYVVNDLQVGEDWIYLDLEVWVDRDIQKIIDRVALVIYGKYGGLYVHEIF